MLSKNTRDMVAGVVLSLFGAIYTLYALTHYRLGTVNSMGPGMFPTGAGLVIVLFGVLVFIEGFFSAREDVEINLRAAFFIFAGVASFALLLIPFGIVPAIVSMTVLSALAEKKFSLLSSLFLSAAIFLIAYVVFIMMFGLSLKIVNWPF